MKWLTDALLAKILLIGSVVVLALIPFHAFLSVWVSSMGVDYTAVRLWKEVILLALFIVALTLYIRSPELRRRLFDMKLIRYLAGAMLAYLLLHLILGSLALWFGNVSITAFGYSLISNLRFLTFFVITLVVGLYYSEWTERYGWRILLWPAAVVVGFGLLQEFVLPYDVLRYFGYGAETIQPYIAVDQKLEFARLQSFLRGPNPLGAYVVVILTASVGLFMMRSRRYLRYGFGILATLLVLYGTFSRSAYIGAALAVGLLIFWLIHSAKTKRIIVILGVVLTLVGAGLVYGLRDNDYVQNVVFHTDENSQASSSSNEERASALRGGVDEIVSEPLGRGPGTAGPASVYNLQAPRISENYFIQIGQEVGVLGISLLLVIMGIVALLLWRAMPDSLFAAVLLASFVGITAINMLSHAWADDTLAYIWWGFAGLVIGSARNGKQTKAHGQKTN